MVTTSAGTRRRARSVAFACLVCTAIDAPNACSLCRKCSASLAALPHLSVYAIITWTLDRAQRGARKRARRL